MIGPDKGERYRYFEIIFLISNYMLSVLVTEAILTGMNPEKEENVPVTYPSYFVSGAY